MKVTKVHLYAMCKVLMSLARLPVLQICGTITSSGAARPEALAQPVYTINTCIVLAITLFLQYSDPYTRPMLQRRASQTKSKSMPCLVLMMSFLMCCIRCFNSPFQHFTVPRSHTSVHDHCTLLSLHAKGSTKAKEAAMTPLPDASNSEEQDADHPAEGAPEEVRQFDVQSDRRAS